MPSCTFLISPVGAELFPLYNAHAAEDLKNQLRQNIRQLLPAARINEMPNLTFCVQTTLPHAEAENVIADLSKINMAVNCKGRLPLFLRFPRLIITAHTAPPPNTLPLLLLEHTEKLHPQLSPTADNRELLQVLAVARPEAAFAAICATCIVDIIGRAEAFPPLVLQNLKTAALWQDSGLLFTPRALQFSPLPLSLPQKQLLQNHSRLSAQLAAQHGLDAEICQIIREHHAPASANPHPAAALLKAVNHWLNLQTEWPWQPAVSAAAAYERLQQPKDSKLTAQAVELISKHRSQIPTPEAICRSLIHKQQ